ncbi:MAG: chemotaxis response regulator protein-glutamate methylesterase [Deltaproteobacteria bacterium]|jgi:two-component system chemotaxis response regulator CheB|nr:chemotaxis response regulator protein-glutamate methylesterase [Deltaproteobacteria bacterium]
MIKVLVVDDSAIVRKIFTEQLSQAKDIEVVATAPDPYVAREKIIELNPDVVTLDIEMPRMDGITFLKKIMAARPIPVIIVSSLTPKGSTMALEAMDCGAVEVLAKPGGSFSVGEMGAQLAEKIRAAARVKVTKRTPSRETGPQTAIREGAITQTTNKVIAIGSSTGGTEALKEILTRLPHDTPGIVVAQHMPANFTKAFADRMNGLCRIHIKEGAANDSVLPGVCLIAPGNYHMLLRRSGARYYVEIKTGPMVHHQRPAVDVLFKSVAKYAGANAIGVILTGMGSDGAEGIKIMKQAGAKTLAQDEASSIVFGMPKEAIKTGCVDKVVSLRNMPQNILDMV